MRHDQAVKMLQTLSLEAHVVDHCNLSCMNCFTGSPFLTPRYTEPEALAVDLARVGRVMHAQTFHLSGGEPLLHPALNRCLDVVRESSISKRIGVITNGFLLGKVPTGFWRRIDVLTISFYASVPLPQEILDEAYSACERHNVLLAVRPYGEFQTFEVEGEWDEQGVKAVHETCWLRRRSPVVHGGRLYRCARAPHLARMRSERGEKGSEGGAQQVGVSLDEKGLREAIAEELGERPSRLCVYCAGARGAWEPHRQVREEVTHSMLRDWGMRTKG